MGAVAEQNVCQPVRSAQRGDKRLKNHNGKRKAEVERWPAPTLCDEEGCRHVGRCKHVGKAWGRAPMPPRRRRRWGSHARSSVTEAHEQRPEHARRQEEIPRRHKDRPIYVRGRLFCLKLCRFCLSTRPWYTPCAPPWGREGHGRLSKNLLAIH